MKLLGGGGGGLQLVCGRSTLALSTALVPQTLSCLVCVEDPYSTHAANTDGLYPLFISLVIPVPTQNNAYERAQME